MSYDFNIDMGNHGQYKNVACRQSLLSNKKINKFINNDTVGALDNYAKHENILVHFQPLENDLFDDLTASVYAKGSFKKPIGFGLKIPETKPGTFGDFMQDLYKKVIQANKTLKK